MIDPLMELFPQYDFTLTPTVRPPKKAQPFFYRIDFLWLVPTIALMSYFLFPYGLLSLLLVMLILVWGNWQFRTAGYLLQEQQLTIVSRFISRVTFFAMKNRIQITQGSQTYFQKRKQIGSAKVVVMSGITGASATVRHIEQQEVENILNWYER